jgi:cysteinyl-tRNA synthetase
VREANRAEAGSVGRADLAEMLGTLGLDNLLEEQQTDAPAEVVQLSERREHARSARDYGESDRLREELRARGWEVRDGPDGPKLLPVADHGREQ